MVGQRAPVRRAAVGFHSGPDERDTAVDNALYEVQAARRELRMTGFCLHQAEAFRRIDRARAGLADRAQFRNSKLSK